MDEFRIRIRILKAISPEVTGRLRKASNIIDFSKTRNSATFLFDELNKPPVFEKGSKLLEKGVTSLLPFSTGLNPFVFPSLNYSGYSTGYPEDYLLFRIGKEEKKYKNLSCEASFQLAEMKRNKGLLDVFKIIIGLNQKASKQSSPEASFPYFQIADIYDKNYIFDLATDFYNKFPLYQEVKNFITLKQKELIKISNNEIFIQDILTLFSAKNAVRTKIKISKENLSKELVFFPSENKITNYKKLFGYKDYSSKYFSSTNKAPETREKEEIGVFVGEKSDTLTLLFDVDFFSSIFAKKLLRKNELTDKTLLLLKEDARIDAMIYKNLAKCLEDYILLADFSGNLISQVKTKFLINKI